MKKMFLAMIVVLMSTNWMSAQTKTVADKELVGAWTLEWMQYDGEKKIDCGAANSYSSFKYYGADGEYACAEIGLTKGGQVVIMPHEYGTYSFKNGVYSEMGRPAVAPSDMKLIDKTHFQGRWMNRTEAWVKQTEMPEEVIRYIVERCKQQNTPEDVQQFLKQKVFKKP